MKQLKIWIFYPTVLKQFKARAILEKRGVVEAATTAVARYIAAGMPEAGLPPDTVRGEKCGVKFSDATVITQLNAAKSQFGRSAGDLVTSALCMDLARPEGTITQQEFVVKPPVRQPVKAQRFDVIVSSDLILELRDFAQARHVTLEQAIVLAMRDGLKERVRQRMIREQRKQPSKVVRDWPARLILRGREKTCLVCGATFTQEPGGGREKMYCKRACQKFVQRYGIDRARVMFKIHQERLASRTVQ